MTYNNGEKPKGFSTNACTNYILIPLISSVTFMELIEEIRKVFSNVSSPHLVSCSYGR